MSSILIDSFSFPSPDLSGVTLVFNVFFDDVTANITYTEDPATGISSVSETQRGKPYGSFMGDYINDAQTTSYRIESDLNAPFAFIASTSPYTPSDPQCDLRFIFFEAINEQTQGGNDGRVVASGATTFTPMLYSIDDINYDILNVFTGLAPGDYTYYIKDANGCKIYRYFTISEFKNPITLKPEVLVSPGNVSRWNAAFNPVVFTFNNTPDPNKKNYHIEIEITSIFGIVVGNWSPNTSGFTRADISAYLQSLVNAKDNFKYDAINWRDMDRSASFTVRYRAVWDGDSTVWYNIDQPYYATWSAMQLGDKYGGNMAQYVTFLNEPNPDFKAKWLTLFEEPTYNVGYPFDLSFIFSEYIIGSAVKMRTISLDINKQPTAGGITNSFILNNDAGYILNTDLSRLIIQTGALPPVSNDGILEQLGINRLMMAGNPAVGVEYFQIQLYTGEDNSPNFITQPIILKVDNPCIDPFVYIKWLNTLGGWDYWRFGYDQVISLNTADGISIDLNVFDWENDETIADTITKNNVKRISFGDVVESNKVSGLMGIHNSTHVMLQVGFNPIKFHTVTLGVGGFEIKRTRTGTAEFKLQITLPQINIQRQ